MGKSLAEDDLEVGSEGLDEVDLEKTIEEELGEERVPVGYETNTVTLAGREFEIGEPSIGMIVEILKVVGRIAVRGEQAALRQLQGVSRDTVPSNRAVLFGMLAAFSVDDLVFLGAAVLQFPEFKEGRSWLRSVDLELAPLVKAFFLNLSQSQDLRESISSFFVGLGMADGILGGLEL